MIWNIEGPNMKQIRLVKPEGLFPYFISDYTKCFDDMGQKWRWIIDSEMVMVDRTDHYEVDMQLWCSYLMMYNRFSGLEIVNVVPGSKRYNVKAFKDTSFRYVQIFDEDDNHVEMKRWLMEG